MLVASTQQENAHVYIIGININELIKVLFFTPALREKLVQCWIKYKKEASIKIKQQCLKVEQFRAW